MDQSAQLFVRETGWSAGERCSRVGRGPSADNLNERRRTMKVSDRTYFVLKRLHSLTGVVPIGLFLLMMWMKPDYIELLWKDPLGIKMSIGAIVLVLIGAYAIKKIVDIKV